MAELTTSWTILKQLYVGRCRKGYLYIRAYARLVSQDIGKNQSRVQYNVSTYYENSAYADDHQGQVAVAGTGLDWQYRNVTQVTQGENSWITKEVTVNHNSDGTANISASAWINFPNWGYTTTATGYASLPTIPRQANIISATNFNDEQNPTINYNNSAGNAVTALEACISWTGADDIKYRAIPKTGSSYTFNLTESERNVLRNACRNSNSMAVTFYVRTTIGGNTFYSVTEKTFSVIGANPTISSISAVNTVAEYNALTGSNTKIIKGFNNIQAKMVASPRKGASIKSYSIKNVGNTIDANSGTFSNIENGNFTFTTTDTRGNSSSESLSLSVVNYVKLTNNLDVNPANAGGDLSFRVSGNYFNGSFGAVSNTLTVQYRYKENNGSYCQWTNVPISLSGNSYNGSVSLKDLNYRNSYTFQTRAIDKIYDIGVNSPEKTVKTTPVFDWGMSDFQFNVPVYFQGKKLIDLVYPVGSIYMSVNSTNPQTLFGGTWVRWGNGRVPVGIDTGQGEFNAVEKTGGEKSHKLTVSEMPSHAHTVKRRDGTSISSWRSNAVPGNGWWVATDGSISESNKDYIATATGGDVSHNNLQPYITCYMWKRTA